MIADRASVQETSNTGSRPTFIDLAKNCFSAGKRCATRLRPATHPFAQVLERLAEERAVREQASFLGKLPTRTDVYEALSRAHLYALPTLRDGPPVALLEAMLAGKTVLCLDLGAPRELVPTGAGFRSPSKAGPRSSTT